MRAATTTLQDNNAHGAGWVKSQHQSPILHFSFFLPMIRWVQCDFPPSPSLVTGFFVPFVITLLSWPSGWWIGHGEECRRLLQAVNGAIQRFRCQCLPKTEVSPKTNPVTWIRIFKFFKRFNYQKNSGSWISFKKFNLKKVSGYQIQTNLCEQTVG